MVKMECETSDKTVKLLPCLMLDVGERMLVAGAEVSRIEDMLQWLGHAYGILHTNVFVITSSISVTLGAGRWPAGNSYAENKQTYRK